MTNPMGLVNVWIDAFIPKTVPGYTQILTKGKHTGKTAIPLPGIARLWPGNTFKPWKEGYLSDQRDFSASRTSSVRMRSLAMVQIDPLRLVHTEHKSSGTTGVDLDSGTELGFKVADMSRCRFGQLSTTAIPFGAFGVMGVGGAARDPRIGPDQATDYGVRLIHLMNHPERSNPAWSILSVKGAAGDPLVGMAADIDYEGVFTFKPNHPGPGKLTVAFEGRIDSFPAFECYAEFNGVPKAILQIPPPPGNTVANLLGGASRQVGGQVVFP